MQKQLNKKGVNYIEKRKIYNDNNNRNSMFFISTYNIYAV